MKSNYAVVFPGQGSQFVGMLGDIAKQFAVVQETFAEASSELGYDLWNLTQQGPEDKLNQTEYTQPALLTAAYAIWRILIKETNIQPNLLAGHSLGEYTALVCANAITFQDAVKLVAARGQYMQEAVPDDDGAMAAIIGLEDETVAAICKKTLSISQAVLAPANYNAIGQVVIAGHKAFVERAVLLARQQGAKLATLISVSVPSHCRLMQPAAERLATLLTTINIQKPTIPIVNNVDVKIYTDADVIRDGLVRQLYLPVRWVEIIQYFIKNGITSIIECGPGKVLSGLNKRIDKQLQLMITSDLANLEDVLKCEISRSA